MQRIRVLVVDDHRIFAESLAAALAAEQDVEVGAAGSGPAALRHLERGAAEGRRFDILLVDADLGAPLNGTAQPGNGALPAPVPIPAQAGPPLGPGAARSNGEKPASGTPRGAQDEAPPAPGGAPGSSGGAADPPSPSATVGGLPLVARVRADYPAVRTVVLAERDDPRHAAAALQAGAGGWVAKDCSLSRLLQVIRGVLKDETHLPPALLTGVLRELTASRKHRTESERLVESLTPREREVLRCMVAGLGRKAVAERLYLSPHTVRTHMQNVLGKLGVHSTLQAVALARRAGVGPAELEPVGAR
ncbi:LuxR C-terminal-related transcriptional regulator [Streptomyces sp. WMMB303]|uniref:response regulator transcription factor n=1 Tax=Streptomyces sp. WMMB303 TaxID=3034154 RepID=UPI0023EB2793|nr:LuxR C-terminal-related transcriptional regulator [Streptomyces sp. WMMB303]MDF4251144.1 LuxR C-terminal-related transcriptional regulator [Streptomyces sp. WMMB303]